MNKTKDIVDQFIIDLRRKYGEATCELNVALINEQVTISGKILTKKQWAVLDNRLQNANADVVWRVDIVTEQLDAPLGWAYVDAVPTNVWSRILVEDHLAWLSSQVVVKEDPIKLLWQAKGFFCVQLIDQTVGWIREEALTRIPGLPEWQPPQQKAANKIELLSYLDRWRGVPYLKGGLSQKGVDCSGLVQNLFRHNFNYLLPRHSMDQMVVGKVVAQPRLGDLAFFEHRHPKTNSMIGHVGFVLDVDQKHIFHSSLEMEKKVTHNTLPEMINAGYTFLGYRNYNVDIM